MMGDREGNPILDDPAMSDQMDTQDSSLYQPFPLLDLAAQATAKYCSASDLDKQREHLDRALMIKVVYHSFPLDIRRFEAFAEMTARQESWRRALKLEVEDGVKEMYQIGFMATAYLARYANCVELSKLFDLNRVPVRELNSWLPRNGDVKVSLLVEKQKIIRTTCSECTGIWCEHVFAAIIHRIKHPEKVIMHAPMTESLSSLSRDRLQKLLQYAVNEDPAGILGKIFKRFNEINDSNSEINKLDGAPDPSYETLHEGEKSQWDLSLDRMTYSVSADFNMMVQGRNYYVHSKSVFHDYYPDSYDLAKKMNSKLFSYIHAVEKFARQEEYLTAAKVMQRLIISTTQKMETITRADCPKLSRWWHDLSHIHALLVLRTEDKEARSVLLSTALHINATEAMIEHLIQTSDWSELPSLTQLFPHETERLSTEGCMMIESVLTNQLQPNPRDLCRLLDGTDSIENTSYNEDLLVMLARLESLFYFDKDQQKITRLGFLILHKLSMLAQQYSILGQFVGSSSDKSDSGAPSSLIKLFCPGTPATSTKQEPESLVSSSSSSVQPMDTDSVEAPSEELETTGGPSEYKVPPKRLKSEIEDEPTPFSAFVWSSSHVTYAMLHTLYIIIESQKVSALDSTNHKVLVGFCLQALELSRYRMHSLSVSSKESGTPPISQLENDGCIKLERTICEYLEKLNVDVCSDAVSMYIDSLCSVGKSFYRDISGQNDLLNMGGAYPLVLVETLCHLVRRDEALMLSKSHDLKNLFSLILLDTTSAQVYNSLLKEQSLKFLLRGNYNPERHAGFVVQDFVLIIDEFYRDHAVVQFRGIIDAFKSILVPESSQNITLLTTVLHHLEYVGNSALLMLISTILQRVHVWRFSGDQLEIKRALRQNLNCYHAAMGVYNFNLTPQISNSALITMLNGQEYENSGNVEKEVVIILLKTLDLAALPIFSKVWQDIFTCKELKELFLYLDEKKNTGNRSREEEAGLTPAVLSIIDEFYDAKLSHNEDACTLLTRYFTPGSDQYKRIIKKIIANSENYSVATLFDLAKRNISVNCNVDQSASVLDPFTASEGSVKMESDDIVKPSEDRVVSRIVPMNQEIFDIVEKAFERLGSMTATPTMLETVEKIFDSCVMREKEEQREDITSLEFYGKLVTCVCNNIKYQPPIILKIVERIDFICEGIDSSYLAQHVSITQLRAALLVCYRNYFGNKFRECRYLQYDEIVREMLSAREGCKKFVNNQNTEFDSEVVQKIRDMYSTRGILIVTLDKEFPPSG